MKTSQISAVTVAMLAMFAVACGDSSSTDSLSNGGSSDRLPQKTAGDGTQAPDPDAKVGVGTGTGSTAPADPNNTVNTTNPSTTTGTGNTGVAVAAPGGGTGTGAGTGTGQPVGTGATIVLNTFSKVWVTGDDKGPTKIGKDTGAGTMDAAFAWDQVAFAADKTKVTLGTVYTRSNNTANNNNSYMQGGFALASLTDKGVVPGAEIALPNLNGNRTFMRPQIAFTAKHVLLIAASEDNGDNNNPQIVMYVADKATGALVTIPNSTRGTNGTQKPTNIVQTALKQGINVQNPNDQRGPHSITRVNDNTFVVGNQYNNQAQEAFSVTVDDTAKVTVNWLVRYSNTAQHCRPHVEIEPGATTGFIAAVEANNQPAEIGYRVSEFNVATGKSVQSKIVVRSDPKNNNYVSEPVMGLLGDKLAITYGRSAQARANNNNGNGHAGGRQIDNAVLISKADLSVVGEQQQGIGSYGRHGSSFITGYGPNAEPALAVISGSSTGTGGGFIQMVPLKADGTLGIKDLAKVYQVSPFSDVANVQARGKNNPNNQARGFINGLGHVPNPGFAAGDAAKSAVNFMPEVKEFSFSTVTGYSGADAMAKGLKNSIWLSLVPAAWQEGVATVPGKTTDTPGTNPDGTGPSPRSTVPGTDPSGDVASPGANPTNVTGSADDATHPGRAAATDSGGCSVSHSNNNSNFGLLGLVIAGALVAARRKRNQEKA